jgi:hypothetical protein
MGKHGSRDPHGARAASQDGLLRSAGPPSSRSCAGAREQLVEGQVHLLAADPLLDLSVDLKRRLGVEVAGLVHHVRERGAGLEHRVDVCPPQRVRRDLRQRRKTAGGSDLVQPPDDRREDPLANAVLVPRAAGGGGEYERVDAVRRGLRPPAQQLVDPGRG